MTAASVAWPKPGETLTLTGVDYDWFAHLARRGDHGVRFAFDRGTLDLMAPSFLHDRTDRILSRFVVALTELLGLPIVEGGTTTLKRRKLNRGIEADEIFWIANAPAMAGKRTFRPQNDPPPDLVIEVDVSSSSVNRLAIYAAMGVPEIWQMRNGHLRFLTRQSAKSYVESPGSLAFPCVRPDDLTPLIRQAIDTGNTNAAVASLREWFKRVTSDR
jgi:Uma2 family endonuclease